METSHSQRGEEEHYFWTLYDETGKGSSGINDSAHAQGEPYKKAFQQELQQKKQTTK